MIFATLKAIHLVALALGSVASLGNVWLMLARGPHDLPAPALEASLRKLYRQTALVAILTLWATGLAMLLARHGWIAGFAFTAKLALATFLLALIAWLNLMSARWARRGGPPPFVPALHVAGAAALLATIVLAAFSLQ